MIDRLVHHAEVTALTDDSYRLKDPDLSRIPTAATDECRPASARAVPTRQPSGPALMATTPSAASLGGVRRESPRQRLAEHRQAGWGRTPRRNDEDRPMRSQLFAGSSGFERPTFSVSTVVLPPFHMPS